MQKTKEINKAEVALKQLNSTKYVNAYWEELNNRRDFRDFVEEQYKERVANATFEEKVHFAFGVPVGGKQHALRKFIEKFGI